MFIAFRELRCVVFMMCRELRCVALVSVAVLQNCPFVCLMTIPRAVPAMVSCASLVHFHELPHFVPLATLD